MPAYKFSPNLATAEERSKTFVAREKILEDLLHRVRNVESGARHCILIAPRGMGKTHLLLLLGDKVEGDESLASRWVVVRFAEEEYSITSLAELFLKIIESLPDGKSKADEIGRDADRALACILDFTAESGKRILLLMDNIQLYFSQFTDTDISRLREILTSESAFLIVGGAPSYFKQMTGYDETFYNFFEPIHLSELKPEEVEEMLRSRAEFDGQEEFLKKFDECRQKIETVARLTGGNPRLILMLYQVMCQSNINQASEAFKRLLDELTPYFQGRMDSLAPQARKVLDTLALMDRPSTPTEMSEAAGLPVNAVSSQLKRLKDSGFVQEAKRRKVKETAYEVTERLFRMWREMRTETGRDRLKFIIRFLELWYTPLQLLDHAGKMLDRLMEAQEREKAGIFTNLQYIKDAVPEWMREQFESVLLYTTEGQLGMAAAGIGPLRDLASYEQSIEKDPNDASTWYNRGLALGNLDRYEEALESFDKVIQLRPDNAKAWYNRGVLLSNLGRHEEALESYDKAVQLQPDHASAWYNRGWTLGELGRYEEALESYGKAVQLEPDDAFAWNNRGVVLGNLGRHEEALESHDKAVQLKPDHANAWNSRSLALGRLARYGEALESVNKAIAFEPDSPHILASKGAILVNLGRHEEAQGSLRKALALAEAQNLDNIAKFAAEVEAGVELLNSLESLKADNLGSARQALKNAIESGKQADKSDFQLLLFGYIKDALRTGKVQFVQEVIETVVSELGGDYDRLLDPFRKALEYLQTKDEGILERLQQEVREVVIDIANQVGKQG